MNYIVEDTATGRYMMPEGDPITEVVRAGKIWDEEVWNWVKPHLSREKTFYDIGAFFGQMAALAVPYSATVLAFECNPLLQDCLVMNVRGTIQTRPLWSTSGKKFSMAPSHFASMGAQRVEPDEQGVESTTLDEQSEMYPASVLKIDLQGSDLHAMIGGRKMIMRDRPAIIFEYEADLSGELGHLWLHYEEFIKAIDYVIVGDVRGSGLNYTILPKERA